MRRWFFGARISHYDKFDIMRTSRMAFRTFETNSALIIIFFLQRGIPHEIEKKKDAKRNEDTVERGISYLRCHPAVATYDEYHSA